MGDEIRTDPTGRWWIFPGGRVLPVIAGGDGEGTGSGGDGSGGGSGNGGGQSGGSGGSGDGGGGDKGGQGSGTQGTGQGGDGGGQQGGGSQQAQSGLSDAERNELAQLRDWKNKTEPELKRARDDAAKYRTDARKKALQESIKTLEETGADQSVIDALKKQLGEAGNLDPGAVSGAAAEERQKRERLESDNRTLSLKIAVQDEAIAQGAKPKLVYGYLLGDGKLSNLDPAADDFKANVTKTVQAAVKEDASLKGGPAPPKSGADLNGGGSTDDKPKSLGEAVTSHYGQGQ